MSAARLEKVLALVPKVHEPTPAEVLLVARLQTAFGGSEFCVKDILYHAYGGGDLHAAIEGCLGKNFFRLKTNLVSSKIKSLLGKLENLQCGSCKLVRSPTRDDPVYYRVIGPPPQALSAPAKTYHYDERITSDGRRERKLVIDPRTGAPVLEMPAAQAPVTNNLQRTEPVELSADSRPPWVVEKRSPTRAELAARHRNSQAIGAFAARHGNEWFIAACEARNRKMYD